MTITYKKSILAISAVLAIHILALSFDWYYNIRGFDSPMHFSGGFAMGILGLAVLAQAMKRMKFGPSERWFPFLFVLGFVMTIGVLWEFHEFILDEIATAPNMGIGAKEAGSAIAPVGFLHQPSIADTMKDLFLDGVGASFAFVIFFRAKK